MRSLSAHLRQTEDHSRLPFHPGCPVCRRDRLAGSLAGDELVSPRVRAAIAAGVLAFSTGGVPAAVASEPDEVSEGTSETVDIADPSSSALFDPGEEAAQLPDEAPLTPEAAPPTGDEEDVGALELEPVTDAPAPVTDDGATALPVDPPPDPEPQPVAPPPPEAPVADAAPEEGELRALPTFERTQARAADTATEPTPAATPTAELATPAVQPTAAEPTASAEPAPVTTRVVGDSRTERAAPGDRLHTVRPGESLWSIAADLLGEQAPVARVAREVNRLWELNDERIATGSPDLLFAGTRLRLR